MEVEDLPKNPVYPDEILLAALLQAGSIRKAAALAGCGVTTIRERLRNGDFRRQYDALKGELLQEAAGELSVKMGAAVERLSEIMDNADNSAAVRVQAAGELLRQGLKYVAVAEIERRVSALEAVQEGEQ